VFNINNINVNATIEDMIIQAQANVDCNNICVNNCCQPGQYSQFKKRAISQTTTQVSFVISCGGSGSGLSGGAIAGIVIGCLVGVLLLAAIIGAIIYFALQAGNNGDRV